MHRARPQVLTRSGPRTTKSGHCAPRHSAEWRDKFSQFFFTTKPMGGTSWPNIWVDRRTVANHLAAEGTTFSAMVDDMRHDVLTRSLRDGERPPWWKFPRYSAFPHRPHLPAGTALILAWWPVHARHRERCRVRQGGVNADCHRSAASFHRWALRRVRLERERTLQLCGILVGCQPGPWGRR